MKNVITDMLQQIQKTTKPWDYLRSLETT
jgi:hypothetical protein